MNHFFNSLPGRFSLKNPLWICTAAVVLSLLARCSMENLTGGGSDIGNPPITGIVMTSEMKPVRNALVMIGSIDNDTLCDSVYTRDDGRFQSKGLPAGLYAVSGSTDSLAAIARVVHDTVQDAALTITLDRPATIKLIFDSLFADTSLKLAWAKIVGTGFRFSRTAARTFVLDKAPTGEMDIKVATNNGTVYTMRKYRAQASCDAYIIVDPALAPEQWVSGGCGVRDPLGRPSVIWVSPPPGSQGSIARVNSNAVYDIAIQFSHPMDTRLTTLAVTGWSTDTSIRVATKSWVGSDVLYLTFSQTAIPHPMFKYPLGTTYTVNIDSTAESVFGVHSAKQYRFSFTPEPCPRLLSVTGFRFKVSSLYEIVDSLPPVISLGDSVSPSISMLDGNNLVLSFNGTPQAPETGIRCFESDTVSAAGVLFVQSGSQVTIHFPALMKSGSGYRVVIDTGLRFKEGYRFPAARTIRWKTLRFTIDNALILGSYQTADATRTVSLISGTVPRQYSTSDALQAYTPNMPVTTWYASAPLDTALLRNNVVIPSPFDSLPVIAEGTKFGFLTNHWLPPASIFRFSVLPGLRSSAGDSLGVALTYSVITDSFAMKEFHVFNLTPAQNQTVSTPRQDTLYNLSTCTISGSSINNLWCSPDYYSAWVNFNAPVTAASAGKLSISPPDGFSIKRVRTGFGLFSNAMLIPDTTYSISLQNGVADTFGNYSGQSFNYRFKTEKFGLKIGNLFGVIFGYQQEMAHLPAQLLPDIKIISQDVQAGQPWNLAISRGYDNYGNESGAIIVDFSMGPTFKHDGQTPIGLPLSVLQPGFSYQQNYLFFSGILDSIHFHDHVHITPDDGSISLKTTGNMLQFSTSLSCRAKTTYSITVDKDFADCYGHTLGDSLSVGFSTPDFRLENFAINNKSFVRDSIVTGITLPRQPTSNFHFSNSFNYPIGITSLENNLTIAPQVRGILSTTLVTSSFSASQLLIPDTLYQISFTTSITDRFGANLDTVYTVNFRTEPFSTDSLEVGTLENGAVFSITSNALLDTSSLLPSVYLQPSRYASGKCVLSADSTGFSFIADSTLRFGDRISVVIDTTLQDRNKHHPAQPDSLTFVVTVRRQ